MESVLAGREHAGHMPNARKVEIVSLPDAVMDGRLVVSPLLR